jgi:hypothetical protein
MIPVYCIGNEVEREEAWRQIAQAAVTGDELVRLQQAIQEWDRIVALLRRPAVNDNKIAPRPHIRLRSTAKAITGQ